ncbi:septal ring lytic transglycosylase RlpA family protein [Mangrovicella endophytica]|uniref:septal ring lytic transglycosylase RlpA family protein n=1 Tax=Mangrovicella endophytica TaxID=2066697 RepID=UPI00130002DB|nr:septal ring lytic transglycosylase RlpA family protein [Mangrovicella endophytica]
MARHSTAVLIAAAAVAALAGCQSKSDAVASADEKAVLDTSVAFSSKTFGVPVSPRVTDLKRVRKGGGREQVGKPYKVRGKWYYPKEEPGYVKSGKASWYGSNFHGRLTANGEVYDMYGLSAAHPTFPLPSYARVTNLSNGNQVVVRVNDRGPYAADRMMDLSSEAAELLAFKQDGIADIKVEYVGKAPLEGDDTKTLMASFKPGDGGTVVGTPDTMMVASIEAPAAAPATLSSLIAANDMSLPGVRPLEAIDGMRTGSVPLPTRRSILSSYAPAAASHSGAAAALDSIAAAAPSARPERIEIGSLRDAETMRRLQAVLLGQGRLVEDRDSAGGPASLSFDVAAGADADALLRRIWQAGAADAFLLRD